MKQKQSDCGNVYIGLWVDEDLKERVKTIAKKNNTFISTIVKEAIEQWLEENDRG